MCTSDSSTDLDGAVAGLRATICEARPARLPAWDEALEGAGVVSAHAATPPPVRHDADLGDPPWPAGRVLVSTRG